MDVLIIDDDGDDREIFCEGIESILSSVNCIPSNGGQEALDYLRSASKKPDYIFLDTRMIIMDGKECLLRIRRIKEAVSIPVVIYSSMAMTDEEREVYKKLGATHFLSKPKSVSELEVSLKSVFKL